MKINFLNSSFRKKEKLFSFFILLWMILNSLSGTVYAGSVELTKQLDKSTLNIGSTIKVMDPFIKTVYPSVNYSSKVALIYGREGRTDLESAANWDLTVHYTMTFYDKFGVVMGAPVTGNSLTINFNKATPTYETVQLFNSPSYNYGSVQLTLTNVSSLIGVPADVRLELTLINENSYNLGTTQNFIYKSADKMLCWNYLLGADSYQLEWVFIDDLLPVAERTFATPNLAFQYKEPVRVNTSDQHYVMNITFPLGKVYFRVRGVGKFVGTGSASQRYSAWKYLDTSPGYVATTEFEKKKNWQYVTTYTEDGNYKKVMAYYDGAMKSRQTSTNLSSEKVTLIGETKYDYEGRPVVSVLPVPLNGSDLSYQSLLNVFQTPANGKKSYDNNTDIDTEPLANSSGSSHYYSSNNNVETLHRNYIPSANGYPFSQVEFTRDGTGRISRQTIPGEHFRLKDPSIGTKYTRHFYATTNETELKRLFGKNVGNAKHYQKNAVVDPNGQVSVSYFDQEGRVIATALAGDRPANLHELDYADAEKIRVNLDETNEVDRTNFISSSTSTILNVVPGTLYDFNYDLKGVINQASGFSTCKECTYDLRIIILDPDGIQLNDSINEKGIHPSTPGCGSATYTDNFTLPDVSFAKIGNYTVIKELRLASGPFEVIVNSISTKPGYPNLSTFNTTHLAKVDRSKCDFTCEDHCRSKVLAEHTNWDPNHPNWDNQDHSEDIEEAMIPYLNTDCQPIINQAITDASDAECKALLQQMLDQIGPGNLYPTITPATINLHPEHCHYLACTNNLASSIYDKKLSLIKNMTDGDIYTPDPTNTANSLHKDPYFANSSNLGDIQTKLSNYNNTGQTLEQFALANFSDSEQQWNFFRSAYLGLKEERMRLNRLNPLSSNYCPYLNSPDAVVSDPLLPTAEVEMNQFVDQNIMESCPGNCDLNVKQWMAQLHDEDHCGEALALNTLHSNEIYGNLVSYCNSRCGMENPLGMMFKEDLGVNPFLMDVQTTLNQYGCNLENIAVANPYTLMCKEVNTRTLTSCAFQVFAALKKHIISVNKETYTHDNNCPPVNSWKPGELLRIDGTGEDFYSSFYAVNNECNTTCSTGSENGYLMMIDRRGNPADSKTIEFVWGNDDAQLSSLGSCPLADYFQAPATGCPLQSQYEAKFFYINGSTKTYIDKTAILDMMAPYIDFGYSFQSQTWDNDHVYGVAVKMLVNLGGPQPEWKTAYLETNYNSPYITWKTNYSPTNIGYNCAPIITSTCPTNVDRRYALKLDGVDDYVSCTVNGNVSTTSAITFEAWVKSDNVQSSVIASKRCTGNNSSYSLQLDNNNVLFNFYNQTGNLWPLYSTTSITHGIWFHVAATYNSTTGEQKLYINGVLSGQQNVGANTNTIMATSHPIGIGAMYGGSGNNCAVPRNFFKGSVDEVRVWNTAKTQSEIQSSMDCPLSTYPSSLVGYWNFDEGMGVRANDLSIYKNHGRVYNNALYEEANHCEIQTCPETVASASLDLANQRFYSTGAELQANGSFSQTTGGWKYNNTNVVIPNLSLYAQSGQSNINLATLIPYTGIASTVTPPLGSMYELRFKYTGSNFGYGKGTWVEGETVNGNGRAIFVYNGGNIEFKNLGGNVSPVYIDDVSIKPITPACLNVYENGTRLLSNCVTTSNKTRAQVITELVTNLNAATTNYTFSNPTGEIIAFVGKPGTGSLVNGNSISIRHEVAGTPVRSEIIKETSISGGKNDGDCCKDIFTYEINWYQERLKCIAQQEEVALNKAFEEWQEAVKTFTNDFVVQHFNQCFDKDLFDEHFTYEYDSKEYHYTLYYYDQAGNLVMTLPPLAVVPLDVDAAFPAPEHTYNNMVPQHNMNLATRYKYDGINNLVYQKTPDGGESNFWYDSKGRLRLSQNAKQAAASNIPANDHIYSFTKYDKQGRVFNVGEVQNLHFDPSFFNNPSNAKDVYAMLDNPSFPDVASPGVNATYLTITLYDKGEVDQKNLRGRMSKSIIRESEGSTDCQTLYSYDQHGNVSSLTQKITNLPDKKMDYEYDLISGKVTKFYYQKGQVDQYIHAYKYDSDNRLRKVKTSADGYLWDEDAAYFYHKHGTLARTELGEYKVQGTDYLYTLQGWIKGANIPDKKYNFGSDRYKVNNDPGRDGFVPVTVNTNTNQYIAQDEFAYSMGYYNGDYTAIGTTVLGLAGSSNWNSGSLKDGILMDGLYNGNISYMISQLHSLGHHKTTNASPGNKDLLGISAYAYQYDQLNRISEGRYFSRSSTGWARASATINTSPYDVSYDYDPNGNIMHAKVNSWTTTKMDQLEYKYTGSGSTRLNNQLNYVLDGITGVSSTDTADIENQDPGNYDYDEIGNLVKDVKEEIALIKWTPYGKVKEIIRTQAGYTAGKRRLVFTYDAMGNRIKKEAFAEDGTDDVSTTYYMRDASGNVVVAIAINMVSDIPSSNMEYSIYGSGRLGCFKIPTAEAANVLPYRRKLGSKVYELSNHLGNVAVVLSDLKLGVDTIALDGLSTAAYYKPITVSGSSYYPFGMMQTGRSYDAHEYRYGFNGKEKDTEWNNGDAIYDYGFRIYDPRISRFLSVDPLSPQYPWLTPYQFASNRPIIAIDIDGLESYDKNGTNVGSDPNEQAIKKFDDVVRLGGTVVVAAGVFFEKRILLATTVIKLANEADILIYENQIKRIEKRLEELSPGSTKQSQHTGGSSGGCGAGGHYGGCGATSNYGPIKPEAPKPKEEKVDPKTAEINKLKKELSATKNALNNAEFFSGAIDHFTVAGQVENLAQDMVEAWKELPEEDRKYYEKNMDEFQKKIQENVKNRVNWLKKTIFE